MRSRPLKWGKIDTNRYESDSKLKKKKKKKKTKFKALKGTKYWYKLARIIVPLIENPEKYEDSREYIQSNVN